MKISALTQFSECIQGMEETLEPQCERYCTRKFAIASLQGRCDALACTSNCVDTQLKECGFETADESLNTLYSELLGAQIAWSWGLATVEEVQKTAETGPASCKKLINLSRTLF
uniref:Uncharacterized protein n=1 Tax=Bursaphelenchus xylophilus TaxID=6326 RepID=A0A1I7SMY0_BURXY